MKILIYVVVFFIFSVLKPFVDDFLYNAFSATYGPGTDTTALYYGLCAALFAVSAYLCARWLCKLWDQRQAEKSALTASELSVPDSPPAEPIGRVYLIESENEELVRVPENRLTDWAAPQESGSSAAANKLRQRVEERVLSTILGEQIAESPTTEEPPALESEPAPTITDPAAPAPATPKLRFCKHCGSPLDPVTRKCTGCGKQYFRPPFLHRKHLFIAVGVLACVSVSTLIFSLTSQLNAAEAKIEELNTQIAQLNTDLSTQEDIASRYIKDASSLKSDLAALQKRYDSLMLENTTMGYKIDFFNEHVVFVPDDGTNKYHIHGCKYLDLLSYKFYAFNIENAKYKGYKPCSYCCS